MTSTITPFIVLIEQRRPKGAGARILWTLMLIAGLACTHAAHARALASNICADLLAAMGLPNAPNANNPTPAES